MKLQRGDDTIKIQALLFEEMRILRGQKNDI